jgi:hypothetical protein
MHSCTVRGFKLDCRESFAEIGEKIRDSIDPVGLEKVFSKSDRRNPGLPVTLIVLDVDVCDDGPSEGQSCSFTIDTIWLYSIAKSAKKNEALFATFWSLDNPNKAPSTTSWSLPSPGHWGSFG